MPSPLKWLVKGPTGPSDHMMEVPYIGSLMEINNHHLAVQSLADAPTAYPRQWGPCAKSRSPKTLAPAFATSRELPSREVSAAAPNADRDLRPHSFQGLQTSRPQGVGKVVILGVSAGDTPVMV
jgi:hypothetical protein